jgi:DNA polymerase-3 subunit gamma/tau
MRDMLGMIETRHVEHILRGLAAHDGASVLAVADDMAERALDYISALDDLLLALQDVAVYQVSPQGYEAKGEVSAFTTELGGLMSPEDVQLYYQIALLAKRDLHLAPDPGSGFQMALLRMLTFIPDLAEDSAPSTSLPEPPQKKSPSKAKAVRQKPARVRNDVRGEVAAESPKRVPTEASNATDADPADPADPEIWTDLVATADLTGITRELAMNLAPQRFIQGVLEVSLVESLGHLANEARIETLEKSLSTQRKDVLKLKLVESMEDKVSTPTPVQTEKRQADEAKQAAYQSMLEDPAVQEMMKRFDATVVPESVRPAKSEEVGK